jgi:hypothetical protein
MHAMRSRKRRATIFALSLISAACSVHRGPPPSLPAVTVQRNPDGTETRQVNAGQSESQAEVEHRLLTSIECSNYEIVAAGQSTEPQPQTRYWVCYRCMGKE